MASDLTRLQITKKAADAMGRDVASEARSGDTVQSILDEMYEWSQLRLARAYSFPELDVFDTTTADTTVDIKEYSFTTLFGASARVKQVLATIIEDGTSSRKLNYVQHRRFLIEYPYPEGNTTRKPHCYTRYANNLWLYPVPDATYDIHTLRNDWPTRATGDTYNSQFNYKDDLLVVGTVTEFFLYMQEFKDAAEWNTVWRNKLAEVLMDTVTIKDWEPEGRAFSSNVWSSPSDYYNDPLIFSNP